MMQVRSLQSHKLEYQIEIEMIHSIFQELQLHRVGVMTVVS